jgi:hypothetical protein
MIWTHKETPCSLEALLHCYYSTTPHPRFYAPAVRQAIAGFYAAGLVKPDPYQSADTIHYICTDRGRAYVEMLCSTPYPVKCDYWKDPRTGDRFGEVEWKNFGERR